MNMFSRLSEKIAEFIRRPIKNARDLSPHLTPKSSLPKRHLSVVLANVESNKITLIGVAEHIEHLGWYWNSLNMFKDASPVEEKFTHWISCSDFEQFESGELDFNA